MDSDGNTPTKCLIAGTWGDPGYFNRWTLEIENHALVPLVLKVGETVGQMVFMRTGNVLQQYTVKGQYQKTSDLETLMQEWSPLCMIPSKAVADLQSRISRALSIPDLK